MPDTTSYPSASGMKTLLYHNTSVLDAKFVIQLTDTLTAPESSIFLNRDASVDLALQLIKDAGREDLLAPPPEKKLSERVGEYVVNADGEVRRITGAASAGYTKNADFASSVDASGSVHTIYNDQDKTWWTPVKVEVRNEETWTVIG